jgi:mono/diheme cytochrome c family protein
MRRSVWVGFALCGLSIAACGAPPYAEPETTGATSGTGGRGGSGGSTSGTGGISTGGISTGGSGGSIGPGGKAGAPGFPDGGPQDPGVFTEAIVESEDAPPPLSGGTLSIIAGGTRAAASDPDHDQVLTVDLGAMSLVSTAVLGRGDEPGRLVEDGAGRVHVVLRSGRAVAVIDPKSGTVVARLPVCHQPRGLAYEAASDAIHVACAGGELVSYTASTGALVRKLRLERDLRDVVVDGPRLLVSRFRAAELLVVESTGVVSGKLRPALPPPVSPAPGVPPISPLAAVAWRTIPSPEGGAIMVHQVIRAGSVSTTPGGYGSGSCGGIISASVSFLRADGYGLTANDLGVVLPIDIAIDGMRSLELVSGAWAPNAVNPRLQPLLFTPPVPPTGKPPTVISGCGLPFSPFPPQAGDAGALTPRGRVVAVAFRPSNDLVIQTREPATIQLGARVLELPGRSRKHTGYELFHLATVGGIACASCHPEGHEDGQVWTFAGFGPRRTQAINGGISGTEPFHWTGDMSRFDDLAHDVFNSRMSGPKIDDAYVGSLFRWIDKIPRVEAPPAEDPAAVERGRALFNDGEVGCASCHAGEKFTNNATVNVGTEGAFQVPSLVGVVWRAPYMHQGCAATLADRFGSCGGGDAHGKTSQLTDEQRADLIAYLETL